MTDLVPHVERFRISGPVDAEGIEIELPKGRGPALIAALKHSDGFCVSLKTETGETVRVILSAAQAATLAQKLERQAGRLKRSVRLCQKEIKRSSRASQFQDTFDAQSPDPVAA